MKAFNAGKKFYDAYPQHAEANFEFARALARNGKNSDAMKFAEIAVKLNPSVAKYILILGRLYLDFKLFEYAAPLLRNAIVRLPGSLLMHWAMADFLFGVGDGHAAATHYQLALTLNPSIVQRPELLKDYIKCLSTIDRRDEAQKACADLAQIPGSETVGQLRLSTLGNFKASDALADEIKSIAFDASNSAENRSIALQSLGNMYNNSGLYDEAFELWSKSRALKNITHRDNIGYQKLEQIKSFYPVELFEQAKPYGHSSELPVFVVGMPRSGTTLTEQIISNHPDAFGVGEMGRMNTLEPAFRGDYGNTINVAAIIKNAKNNELRLRAEETLKLLKVLAPPNKKRIVDKLPTQYLAMGYSILCFPNAKIIHCQRHPADSFISAFQNNMTQFHEYSFDQNLYAETYLAKQALMAHWKACFPQQVFELQYEKLTTQPEQTVRELLEFVGLPWEEKCMQFFDKKRTIKTLSQDQVRNPIYTSSVYRWKNYGKHLAPLFAALTAGGFAYPEA